MTLHPAPARHLSRAVPDDRRGSEDHAPDGGFVNVHKPIGMRSTQAVGRVRRATGFRRVGHCGTLDPLAWGVLPLALGRATRLSRYVLTMPKTYAAVMLCGVDTPSHDLETDPIGAPRTPPPPRALEQALASFRGEVEQLPPDYSAVQVGGVRAYRLVRRGERPDLRPRRVRIVSLELIAAGRIGAAVVDGRLRFGSGPGAADLLAAGLHIECSSGTYVRSLVRDLGAALGCGATLLGLARTRVGPFGIGAATEIWQLGSAAREDYLPTLLYHPDVAVEHLPAVVLGEHDRADFSHGRRVPAANAAGLHRLYDGAGAFLGLATGAAGEWTPQIVWKPAA